MLFAFFEEAISTKADGRIYGGATVKTCQNMSKPWHPRIKCNMFHNIFSQQHNRWNNDEMFRMCPFSKKKCVCEKHVKKTPTVDLKCHQHVEMYVDLQTFP